MKQPSSGISLVVVLLASLTAPAIAEAATTIGQVSPPGMLGPCSTNGADGEIVQLLNSTGNSYAVPDGGGVVTSWTTGTSGSGTMRLRVYAASSSAQSITPVAQSDPFELTADAQGEHPTRIPVTGGEHIGFTINSSGATGCVTVNNAASDIAVIAKGNGPLNVAKPIANPDGAAQPTVLIGAAAVVEPDADRDGFGDETQDACPSQATTQTACDNTITIAARKVNKKKGTGTVSVVVPGPGTLALVGNNIAGQQLNVDAAGDVRIAVKPQGKVKKKLKKKGKLSVGLQISYTPTGGEQGTQSTSIKLKRKPMEPKA